MYVCAYVHVYIGAQLSNEDAIILYMAQSWRFPPPPPFHIEPGGTCTYARCTSPEPPYLGKIIPPISGIGYHWQFLKSIPIPGFLGKSSRENNQKYPLPREIGNTHATPLCIRVGRGRGGGPGDMTLNILSDIRNLRRKIGK